MRIKKIISAASFFWYLFQKPILITAFLALCYYNTDHLIVAFKNAANWVAKQAGVAVTDHVIVVESRKPKKIKSANSIKAGPHEGFMWPVTGPISSPFGPRWGNEFHHGIDIAVPQGTEVACAKDGVVVEAGWSNIYGNYVRIDHGNGVSTVYGHNSLIYVHKGERIKQGETIALSGSTGRSTGPHVHFEVRLGNKAVNPFLMSYDGEERMKLAGKMAEEEKKLQEQNDPDEIKRKYLVTLEKTKKLKMNALYLNVKEALKYWDATIALQYRASNGSSPKITQYTAALDNMQSNIRDALLNVSELLPILATQIQVNNNPDAMVVKETNYSIKT